MDGHAEKAARAGVRRHDSLRRNCEESPRNLRDWRSCRGTEAGHGTTLRDKWCREFEQLGESHCCPTLSQLRILLGSVSCDVPIVYGICVWSCMRVRIQTPSPRRAGGNFDDSETPAHALEPMESPALSKIKRAARGSPSAFACCASPGSYDQTHSELSDETLQATKSPNSSGRKASKDKDTRIAERVATFCTFEEEGTLGIRFEVHYCASIARRCEQMPLLLPRSNLCWGVMFVLRVRRPTTNR